MKNNNINNINTIILILLIILIVIVLIFIFKINNKFKMNNKFKINNKFNSLNNYFDVIYVITIPERYKYIKEIMDSLNIHPIYFKAILKNNIDIDKYKREKFITDDHKVSTGQIACHHSHLEIINKFLDTNKYNCLIFEDDLMKPINKFLINKIIKNAMNSIPKEYDILYLGKCWATCKDNIKINNNLYKIQLNNSILCRHAYSITRKGAMKIKEIALPLSNKGGDNILSKYIRNGYLNSYYIYPSVFFQNRSTIESKLNHNMPPKECVDIPNYISNII
jgi:GR25 family glycosyltransferase involved in LPS biosynthesis